MKRDLVLVLGILLSTASQLRPAGEICLVIWIGLMLGRETVQLGPQFTPALSRLVIFWLLFAVAQCIGTLAGFAIGDVHDQALFMHDVMAYPLLAAISMLCVVGTDAGPRLHRVAWLLVTVGSATLALQVAQAWGWIGTGSIDPWYWDRMRGWSEIRTSWLSFAPCSGFYPCISPTSQPALLRGSLPSELPSFPFTSDGSPRAIRLVLCWWRLVRSSSRSSCEHGFSRINRGSPSARPAHGSLFSRCRCSWQLPLHSAPLSRSRAKNLSATWRRAISRTRGKQLKFNSTPGGKRSIAELN